MGEVIRLPEGHVCTSAAAEGAGSKNHASDHSRPRSRAAERMSASCSLSGSSSPASHLDTVPCDVLAITASSACEMRSTFFRTCRIGLMTPSIFENEFIRQGILSESELAPLVGSGREGGMDASEIIREALEATGLKQAEFAKKVGVGQGTISKWMSDQQSPNTRQWRGVEAFLASQESTRHLVHAPKANTVAVRGLIGAGAQIRPDEEQVPPEGLYEIAAPFPIPDGAIAFRVDGDSQWPRYDPGDVVICWASGTDVDQVIGWEAAVRTADGNRYLKRILRGSERGLFDLESYNAPTIRNARLEWVARVQGVVRAAEVREISRKQVASRLRRA